MDSSDVENPGNNLYVTGLSSRITDRDQEKHFSTEGEVSFMKIFAEGYSATHVKRLLTIPLLTFAGCTTGGRCKYST